MRTSNFEIPHFPSDFHPLTQNSPIARWLLVQECPLLVSQGHPDWHERAERAQRDSCVKALASNLFFGPDSLLQAYQRSRAQPSEHPAPTPLGRCTQCTHAWLYPLGSSLSRCSYGWMYGLHVRALWASSSSCSSPLRLSSSSCGLGNRQKQFLRHKAGTSTLQCRRKALGHLKPSESLGCIGLQAQGRISSSSRGTFIPEPGARGKEAGIPKLT